MSSSLSAAALYSQKELFNNACVHYYWVLVILSTCAYVHTVFAFVCVYVYMHRRSRSCTFWTPCTGGGSGTCPPLLCFENFQATAPTTNTEIFGPIISLHPAPPVLLQSMRGKSLSLLEVVSLSVLTDIPMPCALAHLLQSREPAEHNSRRFVLLTESTSYSQKNPW